MVSYMLGNAHMSGKFLDKKEIEINDIFSDICEVQNVPHNFLPRIQPNLDIDIPPKYFIGRRLSFAQRYSIDGSFLRFHPTNTSREPIPKQRCTN